MFGYRSNIEENDKLFQVNFFLSASAELGMGFQSLLNRNATSHNKRMERRRTYNCGDNSPDNRRENPREIHRATSYHLIL